MKRNLQEALVKTRKKAKHVQVDSFSNLFEAHNAIPFVFWLLVFLSGTCGTLYLVISSVSTYWQFKVSSTLRFVQENRAPLPVMSVCNVNPFATNFALDLLLQSGVSLSFDTGVSDLDTYWQIVLSLTGHLIVTRGYPLTRPSSSALRIGTS